MPALTVVLNPNARGPRLQAPSLDDLKAKLGPESQIHVTRDLGELDALMSQWASEGKGGDRQPEPETLCFYGGDGSVARGLTSLIRHRGEDGELPPILVLRAGTINMLCSVVGLNESVDKTLSRWKARELSELKSIPTLKVQIEGERPHYGFVFAWGVGYRVLRRYYDRSPVPSFWDAVTVVASTFFEMLRSDAESRPLFRAESREDIDVKVDSAPLKLGSLRSLSAGTISRLSLGVRPFAPETIRKGAFHVSATGMPLFRIARHAPTLLGGWGDSRGLTKAGEAHAAIANATSLVCGLSEGFTLDGEVFELEKRSRVSISPGPVVRFWTKVLD